MSDCLVSNCCKRNCSQVPILASPQSFVQIDQVCLFLVTGGHDCGHRWQPNLGFRWFRSTGYWDSYWQAWPLCCCSRHQSSACKKHIYPMYFWEHKPSVSAGTVPDSPIKWNEAKCTIALCIGSVFFSLHHLLSTTDYVYRHSTANIFELHACFYIYRVLCPQCSFPCTLNFLSDPWALLYSWCRFYQ